MFKVNCPHVLINLVKVKTSSLISRARFEKHVKVIYSLLVLESKAVFILYH